MTEESLCPGCQHSEFHKMCPAYGTPYYMSGEKLPDEIYNQRPLPWQIQRKQRNQDLETALDAASQVVNCENELSRHLLILTLLHLDKMSEGDKEKLLACWNGVLGIGPLKFDGNFTEGEKKGV